MHLPAVSLFSNCGAGDLGYARAGFEFRVLAELDERRLSVAALNLPSATTVPGDLRRTWRQVVEAWRAQRNNEEPTLLAACPPCQGMSSARTGRGSADDAEAGSRDERNLLVSVIAKVAHALKPRIILVENVPVFLVRAVRHPRTGTPISAAVLLARSLRRGYELSALSCDLADFGVPQQRKRAFLCFVRRGDPAGAMLRASARAPFPRPSHGPDANEGHVTLRQALGKLQLDSLDAGTVDRAGEGMHSVPLWSTDQYRMVAAIPPNSGAGAWQNDCQTCGREMEPDDAVCGSCGDVLPRPVVREPGVPPRLVRGFRSSSYSRMHAERPAATITTASGHVGSDRTIHPWENRVLSPLECAYLQTFPRDFDWGDALEMWGTTNVRAMIGEAVPPRFTEQHGEVLAGLLTGIPRRAAIAASDVRVRGAHLRLQQAAKRASVVRDDHE
jgi:DNA (cytosine-5)-methyltransferase 1